MKKAFLYILIIALPINLFSQNTQEEYIKKYSEMAVKEMKRSGVPASITLSQGILESASGNSYLAREGNNHFGIKCHKWEGERIFADDDARDECFRKYRSVEDSYRDHSDFLRNNSRYHFLFDLDINDYRGWCHGLKKAGYATSPTYAEKLIGLIEKHKLYEYDRGKIKPIDNTKPPTRKPNQNNQTTDDFSINPYTSEINYNNNVPYILTQDTIALKDLSTQLDLMNWQLAKYNDLDKDAYVEKGEQIYIKPKRNKAAKGNDTHVIAKGESIRDVSQQYAVKLKKLYKYNNIEQGNEPKIGTELNLRKK